MPRSARCSAVHRPTDRRGSARIGAPSVRAARSATLREAGKVLGDPGTDPRAAHGGTRKRRPDSRLQLDRAWRTQSSVKYPEAIDWQWHLLELLRLDLPEIGAAGAIFLQNAAGDFLVSQAVILYRHWVGGGFE